ncbi:MAG: excinuclease ABC subunit UvrA [Clostridia bacterium]|nr:excinuclease ABC subunit UvrA [Clostridia bacterium]
MQDEIVIRGARENNLKNIDVRIPRDKLVVFTGVSGSGKSSLAFDTVYAEGQRRYIESLSSYARMFLGQMERPDIDSIDGLSPAIAIDQKTTSKNPRSTVGTVTEIYDYLRLLYARCGDAHCPSCGKKITAQTVDQMVDTVMRYDEGTKLMIAAPVVRGRKGEYRAQLEGYRKSGFARVTVDGILYDLGEEIALDKNRKHDIDVIVDRIVVKKGAERRIADSIEVATGLAKGLLKLIPQEGEAVLISSDYACPDCGISIPEATPRLFSFNNPFGACPACTGLGVITEFSEDLVVPDWNLSLAEGCIKPMGFNCSDSYFAAKMQGLGDEYGFSLYTPWKNIPEPARRIIMEGTDGDKVTFHYEGNTYRHAFWGVMPSLKNRYAETKSEMMRTHYESFMKSRPCEMCGGKRLKKESLAFRIGGIDIASLCDKSVEKALTFFEGVEFDGMKAPVAAPIMKEIKARLGFLKAVGLDYITLSRTSGTLSGGESQRIRLATQIGSGLTGVIYILDEPSIGLHQRDNGKLIETLKRLRDLGNTLIVVEHDEDTMRESDYIIDIGPGAGSLGGKIVFAGTPGEIMKCDDSLTGKYLSGKLSIPVPKTRRKSSGAYLKIKGARQNNLKNIDVDIPLGVFTCVTGVSGSGKSSLVNMIIADSLQSELNGARPKTREYDSMEGLENLNKAVVIDQSPIGKTPRSNPATYTGAFDLIRELFAMTPESRAKGYKNGRFSFNVKGGRCEACSGDGILKIPMHFLPDISVPCEVCGGARYNRETLSVHYKGKNIAEVLDMTIEEAAVFFADIPRIAAKINTMNDVGLGYLKLGQPSTLLSGGEAQRVKIATELSKRATGRTFYILDEPTTGLHTDDVKRLIEILQRLTDGGNTVLVIEHNLDVIKSADYIIDLGPEGGDRGGTIIAKGTPEEVAGNGASYTGEYLKKVLPQNSGE